MGDSYRGGDSDNRHRCGQSLCRSRLKLEELVDIIDECTGAFSVKAFISNNVSVVTAQHVFQIPPRDSVPGRKSILLQMVNFRIQFYCLVVLLKNEVEDLVVRTYS